MHIISFFDEYQNLNKESRVFTLLNTAQSKTTHFQQ